MVSTVSVNMRTHGLVISVIGSLTPARAALVRTRSKILVPDTDFLVRERRYYFDTEPLLRSYISIVFLVMEF